MNLKVSAFAHVLPGTKAIALFNALRARPVFVGSEAYRVLREAYPALPNVSLDADHGPPDLPALESALHTVSVLVDRQLDEEQVYAEYQRQLTGHPGIHVCYLLLTDECNLRCKYCFIENSLPRQYQHRAMSPATATTAVRFFHQAALRTQEKGHSDKPSEFTLLMYGGEPCLNEPALACALREARSLTFPGNLKIAMVTNGTQITSNIASLLKEHDVGVSVSLDGPKEITDRNRNRGTFDRALAGYERLRDAGISPGVSCTIPPASLERFDDICNWLVTLGVRNVGFNLVTRPAGGFNSTEYYHNATEMLLTAFQRFRSDGIFEDRIMRKVRAFVEGKPYPFDCAACGGAQIVIAPNGEVGICHALIGSRETFVGTVYDPCFVPEEHSVWRDWSRRSPLNMETCRNCRCLGICGGGCPVNGSNGIWGLDAGFCVHAQTIFDWLVWDLYEHAVQLDTFHPRLPDDPIDQGTLTVATRR